MRRWTWLAAGAALVGLGVAQAPPPASYASLHWRYVGPPGNRTDAVAGVPGDPSTYYAGAASGGVFKSTDGGLTWQPIFDAEPDLSIGALAVASSDHNVVWAGTGEAFIRSNISMGDGVYKSTDAGRTWTNMGLAQTGRIPRIVIDPSNPDVVLVCALGTTYAPQPERGVFRSADGGTTWTKTLFVDPGTGCSGLAMDPSNPRILYAGMWEYEQHAWGEQSGGPSSGIYKSTDGGLTWTHLTGHGLPHAPLGKINLAVAPSDPDRVYAMIETGDGFVANGKRTQAGVLWMSDNAGATWTLESSQVGLQSRTHYFNRIAVSSDNPNEVYFLGNTFLHSLDQGRDLARMGSPGGDNHDMWIDPTNAANMAVAHDGGISISHDRGRVWNRVTLPIAQLYHIAVDNDIPYHLFGNVQDNESVRGPSRTAGGGFFGRGAISGSAWMAVGGGESGWAQPDPVNSNIIWSSGSGDGSMGGIVTRMDLRTGQIRNVEIWPMNPLGAPAFKARYRFQWEFPLAVSPWDHNTVYAASQVVHVTRDGGQSWQVISPDLTRNDKSKQQVSGGLTRDNIGVQYYDTIYALGLSPVEKGLIWAGSSDGLVHLTRDGGQHWTDVTANVPGMPVGAVRAITPSPFAAGTAYMTVDAHASNNFAPYVYRTADYGASWTKITAGLPVEPNGWAHDVIEDPYRQGLLFLGTEGGIYVSFNNGDQWQPLQMNLPHAPVYGLVVQKRTHDLDIATYGRGFWILDDITPLENFKPGDAPVLFAPRNAYAFRGESAPRGVGIDNTVGQNPPPGADINYYLPASGHATIRILDAAGKAIRTLRAPGAAGFNRVWWNFRGEPSAPLRAYTTPPGKPWVALNAEGWRNISARPLTLTYPPGAYTVELSVDGQTHSQPLTVLKDPRSPASPADFAAQFAFSQQLWNEQNQAAEILRRAEALRLRLHAVATAAALGHTPTRAAAVDAQLVALEHDLFKNEITNQGEDIDRQSPGLAEKIEHVFQDLESADFPPTQQEIEVNAILIRQLAALQAQLRQIEAAAAPVLAQAKP